jgi:hypothetical protein
MNPMAAYDCKPKAPRGTLSNCSAVSGMRSATESKQKRRNRANLKGVKLGLGSAIESILTEEITMKNNNELYSYSAMGD